MTSGTPITVCLAANTLSYPQGGGHLWVHLNWALGLRAAGVRVIWLEAISPSTAAPKLEGWLSALRSHLAPFGLADAIALCSTAARPLPRALTTGCVSLDEATAADLLINLRYDLRPELLERFRSSVLLDIDPGELQVWMSKGQIRMAPHDYYFTIGETVGQPGARFPDCGLTWLYTPPCVALDWWPTTPTPIDAPFSTVAHWDEGWMEDEHGGYANGKAVSFRPFLDLPALTNMPFALALDLHPSEPDHSLLRDRGWQVLDAWSVTGTPHDYQSFIQRSRAEFSCVKVHCVRLQNAWISDRSLCYLASGKPVIVEHTGPSRILPDDAGLFRFRSLSDAQRAIHRVVSDYDHHSRLARQLAEEHFDARRVVRGVLERALP